MKLNHLGCRSDCSPNSTCTGQQHSAVQCDCSATVGTSSRAPTVSAAAAVAGMSAAAPAAAAAGAVADLPAPLSSLSLRSFIDFLNARHALALTDKEAERSAQVLQEQWFSVAEGRDTPCMHAAPS